MPKVDLLIMRYIRILP